MSKYRSYDSIFGQSTNSTRAIIELSLSELEFAEQRTRIRTDEELAGMVDSIRNIGVQEPILVRPMPGNEKHPLGYHEIMNGRHRVIASRLAGKETIPCVVENRTDDEAQYIVAVTTLEQNPGLSISEKAWAYRRKYEAEKKQGFRSDLTSGKLCQKLTKTDDCATTGDSERTIRNYIRITYLTDMLLDLIDSDKLSLGVGVELSFLSEQEQDIIHSFITEHHRNISIETAQRIRVYHNEHGEVTRFALQGIFFEQEKPKIQKLSFRTKELTIIQNYLPPNVDHSQASDYIIKALDFYNKNNKDAE